MIINNWKLHLLFTLISLCLTVSLLRASESQYILSLAIVGYTVVMAMYRRLPIQARIKHLFNELPQVHIHRLRDDKWFHGPLSVNTQDSVSIYTVSKFDTKEHCIRIAHPKDITRSLMISELPKM